MYRYALTIEYDGSPFHGWQVQNSITTVQGVVFDAIKKLDMNCENLVGAGRRMPECMLSDRLLMLT